MMRLCGVMMALTAGSMGYAEVCRWDVREDPDVQAALRVDVGIDAPEFVSEDGSIRPRISGLAAIGKPGAPDLPQAVRLLPVPAGCRPKLEVLDIRSSVTNGIEILPSPTPRVVETEEGRRVDISERLRDPGIYGSAAVWPSEPVRCDVATMGTQVWARLVVHPMQCDPMSGIFIWHTNVTLRILWEKEPDS